MPSHCWFWPLLSEQMPLLQPRIIPSPPGMIPVHRSHTGRVPWVLFPVSRTKARECVSAWLSWICKMGLKNTTKLPLGPEYCTADYCSPHLTCHNYLLQGLQLVYVLVLLNHGLTGNSASCFLSPRCYQAKTWMGWGCSYCSGRILGGRHWLTATVGHSAGLQKDVNTHIP